MRLRLLLCLALVTGLAAFALIRKPEGKVVVTYQRTEVLSETWMVFEIRNDTRYPVTFVGFLDEEVPVAFHMPSSDTWELKPQSTMEVQASWGSLKPPRSVNAYVGVWSPDEISQAEERYSRFPRPIRDWFMRKYDPHRPAYRHDVALPESR